MIAPDKFKGTLTATEAAATIAAGIRDAVKRNRCPLPECITIPMADGGEGSLDAIANGKGERRTIATFDALLRPIEAEYAVMDDNGEKMAVIEAASIVGLHMLARPERNPMKASSYGLGLAIADAISTGCTEILLTAGGTATNDCGAGMLAALGWRFTDADGNTIEQPAGHDMARTEHIYTEKMTLSTRHNIRVLCDVDNPLLGPHGAASVFGPQKGAGKIMVGALEAGAEHFSALAARQTGLDLTAEPRSGAAGGIGWAMATFCGGKLLAGAPFIAELTGLDKAMEGASIVVTGEGRFDSQTLRGKTVDYIASLASRYGIPTIVMCGGREEELDSTHLKDTGISAVCAITDRITQTPPFRNTAHELRRMAADIFTYLLGR